MRKLRAWHKTDIKMKQPLPFELVIKEGDEAYFENKKYGIIYSIEAVFCDNNWIINKDINEVDKYGKDIYFNDILKDETGRTLLVNWCNRSKCIRLKMLKDHKGEIKGRNFRAESWFLDNNFLPVKIGTIYDK